MPIKYRYALDEDHQVVDVEDLTEADRKDYECIACGHVLRPVMGEIRHKHFRHQVEADVECSGETYLHRLGKLQLGNASGCRW
jgi:competence CoiA-like predicted nuclease